MVPSKFQNPPPPPPPPPPLSHIKLTKGQSQNEDLSLSTEPAGPATDVTATNLEKNDLPTNSTSEADEDEENESNKDKSENRHSGSDYDLPHDNSNCDFPTDRDDIEDCVSDASFPFLTGQPHKSETSSIFNGVPVKSGDGAQKQENGNTEDNKDDGGDHHDDGSHNGPPSSVWERQPDIMSGTSSIQDEINSDYDDESQSFNKNLLEESSFDGYGSSDTSSSSSDTEEKKDDEKISLEVEENEDLLFSVEEQAKLKEQYEEGFVADFDATYMESALLDDDEYGVENYEYDKSLFQEDNALSDDKKRKKQGKKVLIKRKDDLRNKLRRSIHKIKSSTKKDSNGLRYETM
mmetsp:Transcript_3195/g.4597  ORF Transcript_3195/g.4597 Transcript_3195/m.4597 type:complete len:349 (+) Transcript_3195:1-1047(+)